MISIVAKEKDTTGFGKRLRALREAKELSQEALGRLCEPPMSYQEVARFERGDRTPSWETVLRLAKALGVTTAAFEADSE